MDRQMHGPPRRLGPSLPHHLDDQFYERDRQDRCQDELPRSRAALLLQHTGADTPLLGPRASVHDERGDVVGFIVSFTKRFPDSSEVGVALALELELVL